MKKLSFQFLAVIFFIAVLSSCSYGSPIDGIWETNVNGTHFVVLYARDEYCCWLNNQLIETGTFAILDNTIIGVPDNAAPFENAFQLSDDFNHLIVVQEDGFSFFFSRMKDNAQPPAVRRRPAAPVKRKCGICRGVGRCTICFGKGRSYVSGYGAGPGSYVECSACGGSGKCWRCDGTGRE